MLYHNKSNEFLDASYGNIYLACRGRKQNLHYILPTEIHIFDLLLRSKVPEYFFLKGLNQS